MVVVGLVGVLGGCESIECLVGSVVVVLDSPVFDHDSGFSEADEVLDVKALVPQSTVERLDERVLPGGPGFDVGGVGAPDPTPVPHRIGDEFGSVVHPQECRGATIGDESGDGVGDIVTIDGVVDIDGQAFPGELVHDVQQFQPAVAGGLIELEIESPHLVRVGGPEPPRCSV